MFSKAFVFSAVLVAVCAQEHSYSLKTVIKHDQPKQYHHAAPTQHAGGQGAQSHSHYGGGSAGSSHGPAVSSQSIVRHDSGHGSQGPQQSGPVKYFTPSLHQAQSSGQQTAHVHHAAPVQHAPVYQVAEAAHKSSGHHDQDYYAYPKYEFEYKVSDPHTGDNKYQQESRDGDVVKGVYSLHEADGSIRTVEYNSDKHSGFNAYVKHSEPNKHPQVDSHYHH